MEIFDTFPSFLGLSFCCIKQLKAATFVFPFSFNETRQMKKEKFSTLVKSRVRENTLLYLKKKQTSKGKEIVYEILNWLAI
jgi:hypothetical protein